MMLKVWVLVLLVGSGEVMDTFDTKKDCEKQKIEYRMKNPGYKMECMKVSRE